MAYMAFWVMKSKVAFLLILVLLKFQGLTQEKIEVPSLLRSGPMLGYAEMTETVIWLQTRTSAQVQIKYWKQGNPETVKSTEIVQTSADKDFIARFVISNLDFGTKYDYQVYINGQLINLGFQPYFRTQPHWRWRSDPPNLKFAFGSCAYINEEKFDRPGKPYGGDFEIFRSIAAEKPEFMIWLGDNVYFREPDWLTESAMRYRYSQNRELPELQPLLATTQNYAIWDDHDYGPNNSDSTFRGKLWALKVFQDYWANPTYGHDTTKGIFGRFEWGDIEFFLLDNRYHRTPNRYPNIEERKMLGDEQLKWLMESLVSSNATFKIIVSGSQMLNRNTKFESFSMFPSEQKRLFDFIREARIEGVLFLSGDRHHAELIKRTDITAYPLYDFTSSPLTSGGGYLKDEENNPDRVPGTWVTNGVRNFGIIEVSGKKGDRKLTLRTLDKNGKELWRYEISESEIKYPKQ
jgi:alkaline phosphatase D